MHKEPILIVDDESNILQGYKRALHGKFAIDTAIGPEAGLKAVVEKPYAVVVTDLHMPRIDGITFLSEVRKLAPDAIRMMLTGYARIDKAIDAVNRGNVFRFLTKPCTSDNLAAALMDGLEQYHLVMAERELLEKTLKGSIDVLTEILSLFHPDMFGQTLRLREAVHALTKHLRVADSWKIEVAAMLSAIGCVGIPPEILYKLQSGKTLEPGEQELLVSIPEIGAHLLTNIPRLDPVARIIFYQNKLYNGGGFPKDSVAGGQIPLGSRIIKPLADMLGLEKEGVSRNKAIETLQSRKEWYDPEVLEKITLCFRTPVTEPKEPEGEVFAVSVNNLEPGHILVSEVTTLDGRILLHAGDRLTLANIQRLLNYARLEGVKKPIIVKWPAKPPV